MACFISYKDQDVLANNQQFSSLVSFVLMIGREQAATAQEIAHVKRMEFLQDNEFWPGRGCEIETDFPDLSEQKFWACCFLDTARAIFDRRIGDHEHSFWQAQRIAQAYGVGQLFVRAVRDSDPRWLPDSLDYREFNAFFNVGES